MKTNKNEVLFQKLGNTWYVFSVINDDCIYSALPQGVDPKSTDFELFEVIDTHLKKIASTTKRPAEMVA